MDEYGALVKLLTDGGESKCSENNFFQ